MLISSGGQSAHGQPSTTNNETPTILGWVFFLSDRAISRVLLRVPEKTCGLRRTAIRPIVRHIPLSRPFSLRLRSPNLARSPQRLQAHPIQIN